VIDRRSFLVAAPGLTLLAASERGGAQPPRPRALDALGVQLYTLRSPLADDLDGTLAAVARVGYREVELAGLYGLTPREMRARLEAVGLRATSSHQSVDDVRGDWARVLDGARELGQSLVVVPSVPAAERTPEGLRRLADDFDRAGEAARAAGLRFGYHNHDWEHRALADGTVPIDLLLERTEPAVVDWQMDIFWTVHGGADPGRYLDETAGRVTSVHVKDRSPDGRMVDVGAGVIDFAALLPLAERHGLLHAFVEHDQPGDDPIASVRRSYEHLSAVLA
jgi:sugar phosphate isomerase/epimerase